MQKKLFAILGVLAFSLIITAHAIAQSNGAAVSPEEAIQFSSGTGFFISDDGILVTCAHVIENAEEITVSVDNIKYPATVLAKNSDTDLAVLKINYKSPYYFKITSFNMTNLGDKVRVLGFPLSGLLSADIRITDGIISARSGFNSDQTFFQISAPIQPGNSGGPIFNDRYEVIGVAAAMLNAEYAYKASGAIPQNVNFGVKSIHINPLLNNIILKNGSVGSINDAEKATVFILCKEANKNDGDSVNIVNKTGKIVYYVYVSPSTSDNWGTDKMGEAVLPIGQSVAVALPPLNMVDQYDIGLVDEDGDSYTKKNIRLTNNQNIEFTINDRDTRTNTTEDDATSYHNKGLTHYNEGDYDQAIADFTDAIRIDPNYAAAYWWRGYVYAEKGDNDRAIADYTQAIRLDPNDTWAYNNRGNAYSDKDEYDRAIEDYNQAIRLDPNYAAAYNNRGVTYKDKGDYDRAISDYTQAINVDPNYILAYTNRADVYLTRAENDPDAVAYGSPSIIRARDAMANMRSEAAADHYESAKTYAQEVIAATEKAIADGKTGAQRARVEATNLLNSARTMLEETQKNIETARSRNIRMDFTAINGDFNNARTQVDQAQTALTNADFRGSIEKSQSARAILGSIDNRITQANRIVPNDVSVYYNRGNEHYNKGEYDQAIADYTQAISIAPNLTYAYCNRGNAYYNNGNSDRAIADYTQAINIDPNYTLAYTNRGNMYYNRGEYDRAIADYTQAIKITPNDANAKQGLERVRQARGQVSDSTTVSSKTPPERLLSQGTMSREKMVGFLLNNNKALGKRRDWLNNLIDIYIVEAKLEGVNYEIAFAQMCYHTNYLKFEKTFAGVGMNNFCGISSLTSYKKAYVFGSEQIGVKAHIQHLKGYATREPLKGICVDPRYTNIKEQFGLGSAPTIDRLSGKWAGARAGYAREIRKILNAMYD
ncbi:hypothetical protein AGMMS49940_02500 [Spirochaetia bacterium]|nr:hypothetical protein AGMMS49940_02500 [Spirochaetia bacterium]